ncbi:AsmA family protein [Candidatus Omnitrophota bacterium]
MKIFKVIFVGFLLCSILLTIFLVVKLKSIDKTQIKSLVEKNIGEALGKTVDIEKLVFRFSIKSGVLLNLKNISIVDAVNGAEHLFVEIKQVDCGVDIRRLLLDRIFYVKYIDIKSPRINFIQDRQGSWNFENSRNQQALKPSPIEPKSNKGVKSQKKKARDVPKFVIEKIHVDDLQMMVVDSSIDSKPFFKTSNGQVTIDRFSLNKKFDFKVSLALFQDEKNLNVVGSALIDDKTKQVRFDDVEIDSELFDVSFEDLGGDLGEHQEGPFDYFSVNFSSLIHQMILGEKGVLVLLSNQTIEKGEVAVSLLPTVIKNINLKSEISDVDIDVNAFSFSLASGLVDGRGRFSDYLNEQNKISYEFKVDDINLQELIGEDGLPVEFEGKLFGFFKGGGKNQNDFLNGIDGAGSFEVKNARLIDFNLLRFVLEQISVIPNLSQKIEAHLSDQEKEKLKKSDTVIRDSEIVLELKNGELYVKSFEIGTDEITFLATGKIGFQGQMDLEARLVVLSDFSTALMGAVEEFTYLRNDQNQIVIPFIPFSGNVNELKGLMPDVGVLGKEFIKNRGRDELKRVIFKALDMEEELNQSDMEEGDHVEGEPVNNEPGAKEQKAPERILIENILDSIF